MKLRLEISDDAEDEVIIRCREMTEEVTRLCAAVQSAGGQHVTLELTIGDTAYFVDLRDILFFETDDGRVFAHTAKSMYRSEKKLYELEATLPRTFIRISKSCILNTAKVSAVNKSFSGAGEVMFADTRKTVFVSRMYYKILMDTIRETRFSK